MPIKVPKIAHGTLHQIPSAFSKYFLGFATAVGTGVAQGDSVATLGNLPGNLRARCYRNAAQSLSAGVAAKILIDTVSFDPSSISDVATNHRITPNQAGYYSVKGQFGVTTAPTIFVSIYKNGALISVGTQGAGSSAMVADDIYLNGTTDYVELWAYSSANASLAVGVTYQNYLTVLGPF